MLRTARCHSAAAAVDWLPEGVRMCAAEQLLPAIAPSAHSCFIEHPCLGPPSCRFLYFINVRVEAGGGDVFHCELCKGLLLRGVTLRGTNPPAVDVS